MATLDPILPKARRESLVAGLRHEEPHAVPELEDLVDLDHMGVAKLAEDLGTAIPSLKGAMEMSAVQTVLCKGFSSPVSGNNNLRYL